MVKGCLTVILEFMAIFALCYFVDNTTNDQVCIVEYMDGEVERIPCYYAGVNSPIFGGPTVLVIKSTHKTNKKSLSTIKRWNLIELRQGGQL